MTAPGRTHPARGRCGRDRLPSRPSIRLVVWLYIALALAVHGHTAAAEGGHGPLPPLQLSEEVVRYEVEGGDIDDLREQLRRHLLAEESGGSHGRTRSRIELRYGLDGNDGGCRLVDPGIRMTITTTLPEWLPETGVSPRLQVRWSRVMQALRKHEGVHRDHALAAARDLQASLGRLGAMPDCRALRRAVDRAVLRATMKCEFRDAMYDSRTRNGLDQGTLL